MLGCLEGWGLLFVPVRVLPGLCTYNRYGTLRAMTVGELVKILEKLDKDASVSVRAGTENPLVTRVSTVISYADPDVEQHIGVVIE